MTMKDPDETSLLEQLLDSSRLEGAEIERRVLDRLRRGGAECLSHLAVELDVPAAAMQQTLQGLERRGVAYRKPHRDLGRELRCDYSAGEDRWAARY